MEEQRSSKPELWIYLFLGLSPKTLIKMGYSEGTVYKYSGMFPEVKNAVLKGLGIEQK